MGRAGKALLTFQAENPFPQCVHDVFERRFIRDVKEKGAHPILFSLTPRNAWEDKDSTIVKRVNKTFGLWAKQVA